MRGFISEIRIVIFGLLSRKGRSFLTILGIVIGVAGVIIIIALGAGAQSLVLSQISKLGTNLIGVLPGKSNETGPPAVLFGIIVTTLTNQDVEAILDPKRIPHIVAASGYVRGPGTVVWRNQNIDTNFLGTQASYPNVQNAELETGRYFDEREEKSAANVMILGNDVKEELFGQSDPVGQAVKIKNIPFTIIGTMKKQGSVAFQNMDDQVFIPLLVGQQQLLGIKYLQAIRAKVDNSENVARTIDEVKTLLRERHRIQNGQDEDFDVRNLADAIKLLTSITDALTLFLTLMAAISLLVGGIGIMNIMLVTVAERTREIGLRKAVGATKSKIRNQFLMESGFMTMLGGIVGIIVGAIVSYLVALLARFMGYEWTFYISPFSVILAIGVSILTGVVFGLYPSFKAAKLNPIDALRYE